MDLTPLIISTLWGIISLTMFLGTAACCCKDLTTKDKIIVSIIFILGGPIFAASNILHTLLDTILPEGWDMDDDDFKGY